MVKDPPAMQETWVQSLGWEDPLGEGNGLPTPVFWPGEFHGQRSLVGYMGLQRVRHDLVTEHTHPGIWQLLLPLVHSWQVLDNSF